MSTLMLNYKFLAFFERSLISTLGGRLYIVCTIKHKVEITVRLLQLYWTLSIVSPTKLQRHRTFQGSKFKSKTCRYLAKNCPFACPDFFERSFALQLYRTYCTTRSPKYDLKNCFCSICLSKLATLKNIRKTLPLPKKISTPASACCKFEL